MQAQRVSKTTQTDHQKNTQSRSRSKEPNQEALNPILQLQRTFGNRAVGRLIRAKLTIGQPNDKYEQEADRVAKKVMRMPVVNPFGNSQTKPGVTVSRLPRISRIQRVCPECEEEMQRQPMEEEEEEVVQPKISSLQSPAIQRLCPECQDKLHRQVEEEEPEEVQRQSENEEEEPLQAKFFSSFLPMIQRQEELEEDLQTKSESNGTPEVSNRLQSQIDSLKGGGQPLSDPVRGFFEPRLGHDFSGIRVHTNNNAAVVSRELNAKAFTVGSDIAFGAGRYQPQTQEGRSLLAHELTHTIQQGASAPTSGEASNNDRNLQENRVSQPHVAKLDQYVQRQAEDLREIGSWSGPSMIEPR
jgi:hypothetical protein